MSSASRSLEGYGAHRIEIAPRLFDARALRFAERHTPEVAQRPRPRSGHPHGFADIADSPQAEWGKVAAHAAGMMLARGAAPSLRRAAVSIAQDAVVAGVSTGRPEGRRSYRHA